MRRIYDVNLNNHESGNKNIARIFFEYQNCSILIFKFITANKLINLGLGLYALITKSDSLICILYKVA